MHPLSRAILPAILATAAAHTAPLRLHPDNPHYFQWRGRAVALITSGEHYGAVLNLDFDYARYLRTLEQDGLNLTRTFTGSYVEPAGAFGISHNTLAPTAGRFICPWARSEVAGYPGGGSKFDLNRWDPAYFARLHDFLKQASHHGVVVELNLFCPFYDDSQWKISPQNPANNINGVGPSVRTNVYTLDRNAGLLAVQDAMTRKLVTELNAFDNLYFEICNEPYFGGVTLEWQHHIAEVIAETERTLPKRHLVSRNVANGSAVVDQPHPAVSIYNFHYAYPPDAVSANRQLNRVIGDNETGFRGTNNLPYRVEAWSFLLAGGALFNHLDYSFVAGNEDGTYDYPANQPGGGNPTYRRELKTLREFMNRFDLRRVEPMRDAGKVDAKGFDIHVLGEPRKAYGLYVAQRLTDKAPQPTATARSVTISVDLPEGTYAVEWLDPVTGTILGKEKARHNGGWLELRTPEFREDLAARFKR